MHIWAWEWGEQKASPGTKAEATESQTPGVRSARGAAGRAGGRGRPGRVAPPPTRPVPPLRWVPAARGPPGEDRRGGRHHRRGPESWSSSRGCRQRAGTGRHRTQTPRVLNLDLLVAHGVCFRRVRRQRRRGPCPAVLGLAWGRLARSSPWTGLQGAVPRLPDTAARPAASGEAAARVSGAVHGRREDTATGESGARAPCIDGRTGPSRPLRVSASPTRRRRSRPLRLPP